MSTIAAGILADAYVIHREQLAYHEIGHALIASAVGRHVDRISVNAHGGLTTSSGPASPLILLLVSLAGDRAEQLAPDCMPDLIGFGPSNDQQDVDLALDLIAGGPVVRDFILQDAIREVDALLTEQRDRLDRIARLLLRRGRVEGYELRQLLE